MEYNEIIDIVADIYRDYEIAEFGFNIFDLCEKMGFQILKYSSFESDLLARFSEDAFSFFDYNNNKPLICYNDKVNPKSRVMFTIPHEIGHIIFGHIFKKEDVDSICEKEANCFAREFYCPQAFIIYYKFKVNDLCNIFKVSLDYARVLIDRVEKRLNKDLTLNEKN